MDFPEEESITIIDMEAIALGQMNLTPQEFERMHLRTFLLKLMGLNRVEEQRHKAEANLVRLQTVALINVQLESKDRITDPTQLWQFSWEAPSPSTLQSLNPLSEKDIEKHNKKMVELIKKL